MKRFFGIILIIISCVVLLFSLLLMSEGTEMAVISIIILFIPGIIVLVTGIKMCGRPKLPVDTDPNYYYSRDEEYYGHEESYAYDDEEDQEPVSVNCPGCGAKVKAYPHLSSDCEYCGTTIKIS